MNITRAIQYFYGLFLLGTGIMTIYFWLGEVNFTENASEKTALFMKAMKETGYIIPWMGIFKTITGALLFFKRTEKVGILMALPYAINILLYVIFVSHEDYLLLGIADAAISIYLVYAYWNDFKPLWSINKDS